MVSEDDDVADLYGFNYILARLRTSNRTSDAAMVLIKFGSR